MQAKMCMHPITLSVLVISVRTRTRYAPPYYGLRMRKPVWPDVRKSLKGNRIPKRQKKQVYTINATACTIASHTCFRISSLQYTLYTQTPIATCTSTYNNIILLRMHAYMHTHSQMFLVWWYIPLRNAGLAPSTLRGRLVSFNQLAITAGITISFFANLLAAKFLVGWT